MIGGDPGALRARGSRIRDETESLAGEARRLRAAADVRWHGAAGDTFVRRLDELAGRDDTLVTALHDAADRLDHLARLVEERQHELGRLLAQAGRTVDDAEALVSAGSPDLISAARSLANAADQPGPDAATGGHR